MPAPPLASSLLQQPIHSNPAFSFIKQQYRNWFCWGLCFLSSGLRLPVVLATMPLDDARFLECDFDFIPTSCPVHRRYSNKTGVHGEVWRRGGAAIH